MDLIISSMFLCVKTLGPSTAETCFMPLSQNASILQISCRLKAHVTLCWPRTALQGKYNKLQFAHENCSLNVTLNCHAGRTEAFTFYSPRINTIPLGFFVRQEKLSECLFMVEWV